MFWVVVFFAGCRFIFFFNKSFRKYLYSVKEFGGQRSGQTFFLAYFVSKLFAKFISRFTEDKSLAGKDQHNFQWVEIMKMLKGSVD